MDHGDGLTRGAYPSGFVCPSNNAEQWIEFGDVIHSYGMNRANHPTRNADGMFAPGNTWVYHRPGIPSPSQRIQMEDANEWHLGLPHANYIDHWDAFGETRPINGGRASVAYRHSEGANLQHFDGHVEYYTKEEAWTNDAATNEQFWRVLQE